MNTPRLVAGFITLALMSAARVKGGDGTPALTVARQVPSRTIPVPIGVSAELRESIARPLTPPPAWFPKSADEWRHLRNHIDTQELRTVASLRERFPVTIEEGEMGGVKTRMVIPQFVPPGNNRRILMHLHGGAFVFLKGEAGLGEAILMAQATSMRVVSVDYRMPPDAPFPAALDDAVSVWEKLMKRYLPRNTGLFGTSAGGNLTLALVHRLKALRLPLPAAIAPGSPAVDLNKTGDSWFTNEMIDNAIPVYEGVIEAAIGLYAGEHDLKDPQLSPLYGDFGGFPPTILTTGTRDVLLSDTVRVHRRLRQAGVEAVLQVFEGLSHGQHLTLPNSTESREAHQELARFFEQHLGR